MIPPHQNLMESIHGTGSLMAVYDKKTNHFKYHRDMLAYFGKDLSNELFGHYLEKKKIICSEDAREIEAILRSLNETNSVYYKIYSFGVKGHHILSFTYWQEQIILLVKLFEEGDLNEETMKYDELTKLISRTHFCTEVSKLNLRHEKTPYALCFFDIIKFKAVNDMFGFHEGDRLLQFIADCLRNPKFPILTACRVSADRFAFLADVSDQDAETLVLSLFREIKNYQISFELHFNAGIYLVPKTEESGNSMLDKAMLAQEAIKGIYTRSVNFFTENLRHEMLSEQEIAGEMNTALAQEQFLVYYQPQYNHSTGMLVGAEALVRWLHPTKGMISPGRFIPLFEKNGFITKFDFHVFEKVAQFLRDSIDHHFSIVPISVNFSKHDIFSPNFTETLETIRKKYDVPTHDIRIEITESILMGNNAAVNDILNKLHACGYIIEMDDFGSGYSSLNVLKDLDFDIIKLDMLFLENKGKTGRGGTILSSVVNMAKWLNIPVIAEGVETVEQADFLKSIGCNYIQGYLYSKPLPQKDYELLISQSTIGAMIPQMNLNEALNSANFWQPNSQETLIFSNFVGAAAIFSYHRIDRKIDILRVNQKYLRELGMNLSEKDIIHCNPTDTLDEYNKNIYLAALECAIETEKEQECETWRNIHSDCCGDEHFCIRSTVTVIGKSDDQVLFYCMIRNITSEKNRFHEMTDTEKRFKIVSDQVNIYFWEYHVATREMRPCFRCMRDLGFPPVLRNYPESAIENGTFPPEVADMYRDWHIQIANGVKELSAIIPLTPNRIPFHVRYTTEFDENGHAVKAYGSAALVVD